MSSTTTQPTTTQLTTTQLIIEYSKTTKNVCMCLAIASLLIIVFILSPLNSFLISSIFGKAIILSLLIYMIYYNLKQTTTFSNNFNISFTDGNWNPIKTNIVCSYAFSAFLLVLMVSVFRG
jgi:hypothetical protein